MKLWITAVPRPIGFKDLRHSHATILRKQRVDLGTVQKELGHSSSEITARVYDQSGLEDDRQAIERALTFAPSAPTPEPPAPPRHVEPVVSLAVVEKNESPAASGFPRGDGAFRWSGRLDLNQRPLAPQEPSRDAQAGSPNITRSQAVETTETYCADDAVPVAPSAAGVTRLGEPVVIPLDELIDAALEAEAWALDARLARAESIARSEVVHRAAKALSSNSAG